MWAIGHLDVSTDAFWLMKPAEFFMRMHVYNETREGQQQFQANLIRQQTSFLVNLQLDKKNKVSPKKLWPLWFDEKEEPKIIETAPDNIQQLIKAVNG